MACFYISIRTCICGIPVWLHIYLGSGSNSGQLIQHGLRQFVNHTFIAMGMPFTVGIIPISPFSRSDVLNQVRYVAIGSIPCIQQGLCYLINNSFISVGMTFAVRVIIICLILLTQQAVNALGCFGDRICRYRNPFRAVPPVCIIGIFYIYRPPIVRLRVSRGKVGKGVYSLFPVNCCFQCGKLIINLIPSVLIIPNRLVCIYDTPDGCFRRFRPCGFCFNVLSVFIFRRRGAGRFFR